MTGLKIFIIYVVIANQLLLVIKKAEIHADFYYYTLFGMPL